MGFRLSLQTSFRVEQGHGPEMLKNLLTFGIGLGRLRKILWKLSDRKPGKVCPVTTSLKSYLKRAVLKGHLNSQI